MEYTSNIVLSLLMHYRGRPHISAKDKKIYRWAAPLPDTMDELSDDMLYVCRLSEALNIDRSKLDCHFACICDCYLNDEEQENEMLMKNLILVEEKRSVFWLLNLIQSRFLELERWEQKMKDVLLRDGGYQDIMDISEDYLKNALFVMDGAYRLVAHSKNYKSPDPINVALYEKGYHSPEVMEQFYKYNRIDQYYKSPGVFVGIPGQISQYETLCKWCWYEGSPLLQVIEVFYNEPMSAESVELFELMMHYINICFIKEQRSTQTPSQKYSMFLRDIVYGELSDVNQIAECAKHVGIPVTGDFDAYRICFINSHKVLIGRFIQELSAALPNSKIISKDYEISILNIYSSPEVEKLSEKKVQSILPILSKHDAHMGISAPFTILTGFGHACEQAALSIHYGTRDYRFTPHTEYDGKHIYHYKNILIYHLLALSNKGSFDFFRSNPYLRKLNQLANYDREHGTNLLSVLYWFLYYERRITDAGKKLHMHRNTVNYHIQHITEMLDIDLDNYMVRHLLMSTYHYLELNAANE